MVSTDVGEGVRGKEDVLGHPENNVLQQGAASKETCSFMWQSGMGTKRGTQDMEILCVQHHTKCYEDPDLLLFLPDCKWDTLVLRGGVSGSSSGHQSHNNDSACVVL